MLGDKNPTPVGLNAQVMLNCFAGGTCQGGNPGEVYEYAFMSGVPDSSCEQYVAKGPTDKTKMCESIDVCKDCTWPPCPVGESCQDKCWAVKSKMYYVSNFYSILTAQQMKADIYKYGPISCGIQATDKFVAYTGGIYSEEILSPALNHEIAVVGWGVDPDSGDEYWIGRNSWGTYWGEWGYFKMLAKEGYDLGITYDCSAGRPTFKGPTERQTPDDAILF